MDHKFNLDVAENGRFRLNYEGVQDKDGIVQPEAFVGLDFELDFKTVEDAELYATKFVKNLEVQKKKKSFVVSL